MALNWLLSDLLNSSCSNTIRERQLKRLHYLTKNKSDLERKIEICFDDMDKLFKDSLMEFLKFLKGSEAEVKFIQ